MGKDNPAAGLPTRGFPNTEPSDEPQGAPSIPGYRIIGLLGQGGMGTVWLAEDVTLERQVAVKLVSGARACSDAVRARFLREARTMASVEHPNVVRLYAFGESGGCPYLVMERVEGSSLDEVLRERGALPPGEAVALLRECALALEAAAKQGLVHRDIKPANILLDREGHAHVADFGLARSIDSGGSALTKEGHIVGTLHYMSPEQARGETVDSRSDIYSLGLVFCQMLTGERPFDAATPVAVLTRRLAEAVPDPRHLRPELPVELSRLVAWMTAHNPDDRPPSYAALLATLNPDRVDVPVRSERRRWPLTRVVLLALLGAVLAGAWIATRVWHRQWTERAIRSQFIILLAPFHLASDSARDEAEALRHLLEESFLTALQDEPMYLAESDLAEAHRQERAHTRLRVVRNEESPPPRSRREVEQLAARTSADLVVWGTALRVGGETVIQPHIWRASRRDDSKAALTPSGMEHSAALAEHQARARDIAALALKTLAIEYYGNALGDERRSLDLLERVDSIEASCQRASRSRSAQAAWEIYQTVLAERPGAVCAHLGLGRLAYAARPGATNQVANWRDDNADALAARAERHFRTALSSDPGNLAALRGLSHCLARLGKLAERADTDLRLLEMGEPLGIGSVNALEWLGRGGEAERVLDHIGRDERDSCAGSMLEAGHYDRVRACLGDAPRYPRDSPHLFTAALGLGRLDDAAAELRHATRRDWGAWLSAAFQLSDWREQATLLAESEPLPAFKTEEMRGLLALHQRRFGQAREHFARADVWTAAEASIASWFIQGDWEGAERVLTPCAANESVGCLSPLWDYFLRRKQNRPDALAALEAAPFHAADLEPLVAAVIRGAVPEEEVVRGHPTVRHSPVAWRLHSGMLLGWAHSAAGNREAARAQLGEALRTERRHDLAWLLAEAELTRLE